MQPLDINWDLEAKWMQSSHSPKSIHFLTGLILHNLFALYLEAQWAALYHITVWEYSVVVSTLYCICLFNDYFV
jgi:hypothetical protein